MTGVIHQDVDMAAEGICDLTDRFGQLAPIGDIHLYG
jgi:hypothetical protein